MKDFQLRCVYIYLCTHILCMCFHPHLFLLYSGQVHIIGIAKTDSSNSKIKCKALQVVFLEDFSAKTC